MSVPSAVELVTGRDHTLPDSARGIYLDRRRNRSDVHMRFTHGRPNRWLWLHKDEPFAGAMSDGLTRVILEDGVAVHVTRTGDITTTHRLENLFTPSLFDFSDYIFGDVLEGDACQRPAWLVSATTSTSSKSSLELAFDQESRILIHMQAPDAFLGFEQLELNCPLDLAEFTWAGPVEPRKVGAALVKRDLGDRYSAVWEIAIRGRTVFHESGPTGMSRDEAVAWAESRAARIEILSG